MVYDSLMWGLIMFGCSIQALLAASKDDPLEYMSKEEREALKFVSFSNMNYTDNSYIFKYSYMIFIIGKKPEICFIMHIMLIW